MGVCFVAYSVSQTTLSRVLEDPPLVWRVLEPDDDTAYLKQLDADNRSSLLARLFGKPKPPPVPRSLDFSEGELRILDLDKSWDGLRLCIGLCAPEAPDFFAGEGEIGQFEIGYGPALYMGSATLAAFASALRGVDEAALLARLGTADFKDVYLSGVWARRDEEASSYLLENFRELQGFAGHCAAHDHGAILQYT